MELLPPPDGLSFQPANDPTGNGVPSVQAVFRRPDGTVAESHLFAKFHGSTIRWYVAPASASDGDVFALDPSDSKPIIEQI